MTRQAVHHVRPWRTAGGGSPPGRPSARSAPSARRPRSSPLAHRDRRRRWFSATTGDGWTRSSTRVERRDLPPVGVGGARGLRVQRRDRGLQRVAAGGAAGAAPPRPAASALGDLRAIPARAVLLLERHELAAARRRAPRAASRAAASARSRPATSARAGSSSRSRRAEPDRLAAQLAAHQRVARGRGVALVEDEVDDAQHARRAARASSSLRRHRVGDRARRGSSPWRARAAAPSSAGGDQERARDLLGRRARTSVCSVSATCASERERRMAAREDQAQPVVGERLLVRRRAVADERPRQPGDLLACFAAKRFAAPDAGRSPCAAPRDTSQARGFVGALRRRPLLERARRTPPAATSSARSKSPQEPDRASPGARRAPRGRRTRNPWRRPAV